MARIDISNYKLDLLRDIFNCKTIVEAIDSQENGYDPDSPDSLIYKNLYPFWKVVDTQTNADCYILVSVDLVGMNRVNTMFSNIHVNFRILCHQDRMKMKNKNATRIDFLSMELRKLFNNQTKYGVGVLRLVSDVENILSEKYQYRDLTFHVTDIPQSICDS